MIATSTIEPAARQLVQGRLSSELADGDPALALGFPCIVYLDTVDSTKGHTIVVPDEVIRIYRATRRQMQVTVTGTPSLLLYPRYATSDWSHTSGHDQWHYKSLLLSDYGASSTATSIEWPFEPSVTFNFGRDDEPEVALHPAVQEFAQGNDEVQPTAQVVDSATRIVTAAIERTADSEISVDVDGALSFVLRLNDGRLVLAELNPDGVIDASRYDDEQGTNVKRFHRSTAEDLIKLF